MLDKSIETQIATISERVAYMTKTLDEMRDVVSGFPALKRDQEYEHEILSQINNLITLHNKELHRTDKRVLVLEKWNKTVMWLSTSAMAVIISIAGYAINYVNIIKTNNDLINGRISALEFIVNSSNSHHLVPPKVDATTSGSK